MWPLSVSVHIQQGCIEAGDILLLDAAPIVRGSCDRDACHPENRTVGGADGGEMLRQGAVCGGRWWTPRGRATASPRPTPAL